MLNRNVRIYAYAGTNAYKMRTNPKFMLFYFFRQVLKTAQNKAFSTIDRNIFYTFYHFRKKFDIKILASFFII